MFSDVLTFLRFASSGFIVYLGLIPGDTFPIFFYTVLFAWETDILDGYIARVTGKFGKLGKYDFLFDMVFVWSTLLYFYLSGRIALTLFVLYNFVSFSFITIFPSKTTTMTFAVPVVFAPFVISFFEYKSLSTASWIWIVINFVLFHKRFFEVIASYIKGLKREEEANHFVNKKH